MTLSPRDSNVADISDDVEHSPTVAEVLRSAQASDDSSLAEEFKTRGALVIVEVLESSNDEKELIAAFDAMNELPEVEYRLIKENDHRLRKVGGRRIPAAPPQKSEQTSRAFKQAASPNNAKPNRPRQRASRGRQTGPARGSRRGASSGESSGGSGGGDSGDGDTDGDGEGDEGTPSPGSESAVALSNAQPTHEDVTKPPQSHNAIRGRLGLASFEEGEEATSAERSELCTPTGNRGPSAKRLAGHWKRSLERLEAKSEGMRLHRVSLGVGDPYRQDSAQVLSACREYLATLLRRWPSSGGYLALDEPENNPGHFHVHGFVMVPGRVAPVKLISTWTRLWPKKAAAREAQDNRAPKRLFAQLLHDFKRASPRLPELRQRIIAAGSFESIWQQAQKKLWKEATPKTVTAPPRLKCRWCSKALSSRQRRWCSKGCAKSGSRKLNELSDNARTKVDAELEHCSGVGLRDIIRTMEGAQPLQCQCGKPVAKRSDARACGSNKCRQRRYRERKEATRKAVAAWPWQGGAR